MGGFKFKRRRYSMIVSLPLLGEGWGEGLVASVPHPLPLSHQERGRNQYLLTSLLLRSQLCDQANANVTIAFVFPIQFMTQTPAGCPWAADKDGGAPMGADNAPSKRNERSATDFQSS